MGKMVATALIFCDRNVRIKAEDILMRIAAIALVTALSFLATTVPAHAAGEAAGAKNPADKTATKKSDKKDAKHAISTSPNYIGIEPIYTTILDGDFIAGTLMLGIGLDIPDAKLRDQAEQNLPLLRDAYVRTMLVYTSANIRPWRQPDAEDIAEKLQNATDRKLKRKGAHVLLAQIAIRVNN